MTRVVLATRNDHKVLELRAILADVVEELGLEIVGASEFPGAPDVVEDEVTFEGNARLKARGARRVHRAAVARRRLGPGGRRARRCSRHLLGALGRVATATTAPTSTCSSRRSPTSRTSTARRPSCAPPCSRCRTVRCAPPRAGCRARSRESPRARNGFGYDPVLVVEGDTRHAAELVAGGEERDLAPRQGVPRHGPAPARPARLTGARGRTVACRAQVAESADAPGLGPGAFGRAGSSPALRTGPVSRTGPIVVPGIASTCT